jgi:hypothetical protein
VFRERASVASRAVLPKKRAGVLMRAVLPKKMDVQAVGFRLYGNWTEHVSEDGKAAGSDEHRSPREFIECFMPEPIERADFLRRRNALWLMLRLTEEGTPEFEAALSELSGLIGWDRERVLNGLGLQQSGPEQ